MNSCSIKVGDWVQIANKVAMVISVEPYRCEVVYDGMPFRESYDNISGIPITWDFLAVNGFVYDGGKGVHIYLGVEEDEDEDFPDISMTYRKPFPDKNHYFNVCLFGNWVADIEFIHEYQHILWALGHNDRLKLP